jgi:hypothetical protein
MTDAIQLIPTDQIDAEALPRDRSVLAPAALIELQRSISTSGLRLPIKLFPTEGGYGLISGYQPEADPLSAVLARRFLMQVGRGADIGSGRNRTSMLSVWTSATGTN